MNIKNLMFGLLCFFVATNIMSQDVIIIDADEEELNYPDIHLGVRSAGVLQFLNHTNANNTLPEIKPGLQSAVGNLQIYGNITDGIKAYVELYLSSRHHVGDVYDREGYVLLEYLPRTLEWAQGVNKVFKYIDLKVGHFEVNYGDWRMRRSDNADVQQNPLIGNYLVDANTVGVGGEVYFYYNILEVMGGVTTGTTTGDFKEGRGFAKYGKVAFNLFRDHKNFLLDDRLIRLSGSVYRVDLSDNPATRPQGSINNLFNGNFSGSRYEAVLSGGPEAGQIVPQGGQDVTGVQLDLTFKWNRLNIWGMYGFAGDNDVNGQELNGTGAGTPEEQWNYFGAEAQFEITDKLYVAGRYSGADARTIAGVDSDGYVDRIQGGLGYELIPGILVKGEYVTQQYRDFTQPVNHNGLDFNLDPEFSGFVAEVAIAFDF